MESRVSPGSVDGIHAMDRILVGPTASGKTAISLELATRHDLEIISLDSMQVYRGLPILTQALPESARLEVIHHLVGTIDPEEDYDTGRYVRDALLARAQAHSRGRNILFVGGTVLYYKALAHGLAPLPPRDDRIRSGLEARLQQEGSLSLWRELETADPHRSRKIHPNDARRIIRALEILKVTGRPPSSLMGPTENPALTPTFAVALQPELEDLDQAIEQRVVRMFEEGLVAEVKSLEKRIRDRSGAEALSGSRPATILQAVGVSTLRSYLAGEHELKGTREQIVRETRRLARKQMRAFQKAPEIRELKVAPGESTACLADRVWTTFADMEMGRLSNHS